MPVLYLPEILLANGLARSGVGLLVDDSGFVAGVTTADSVSEDTKLVPMPGRALLPGLANAHSHTFQRLFRGRAESRGAGGDTFWTWREQMYRAAGFCSPEDVYDVARATFLEMVAAGITVVGEFHYLHRNSDGSAYADPNLLSKQVIAAAQSVGLRICLLRTAYIRAGFERDPHPGQRRFYESPTEYLDNLESLAVEYAAADRVTVGAAPHSIRAVQLESLTRIAEFARGRMPLHLHISEQIGENSACTAEYGATPVELLAKQGVLSPETVLVHAIHLTEAEYVAVANAGTTICSCPTTERNLGDGIFPADTATRLGIPVAFGTDSQAQIDILEDARQMEYHLRLRDQRRGILDSREQIGNRPGGVSRESIGAGLFRAATANGYAALGLAGGRLSVGEPADFFTVDLGDLSVLGLDTGSLEAQAVFSLAKSAVRDVAIQGRSVLEDGRHSLGDEIKARYGRIQKRYLDSGS